MGCRRVEAAKAKPECCENSVMYILRWVNTGRRVCTNAGPSSPRIPEVKIGASHPGLDKGTSSRTFGTWSEAEELRQATAKLGTGAGSLNCGEGPETAGSKQPMPGNPLCRMNKTFQIESQFSSVGPASTDPKAVLLS